VDGFRLLRANIFQSCYRCYLWLRSQLSLQNQLNIQPLSDQIDKSDPVGRIYQLSCGIIIGFFRNHHSFYMCSHHGTLCIYEHFGGITKRNRIGF